MGKCLRVCVNLWSSPSCDVNEADCEEGKYLTIKDENAYHAQESGYIAETDLVNISGSSAVLGVSDDDSDLADTSVDWVEIPAESESSQAAKTKIVVLPPSAKKEAVVNRTMLKVLGIDEGNAVGEKFNTSFVVTGDLLFDGGDKIESEFAEYVIVGVIPGDKTPVFYVPFVDLRSLGIANYSQVTVVLTSQKEVSDVRGKIEAMGFATSSVVDTVKQINSLFATVRIILALLGTVALSVAALGMFNTLTVSLLERTREVGLMKAMGMRSSEVRELFLTESMIMGFFGGVIGIIIGFIGGKLVSLILSAFALFKGVGFVNVSHIPALFVFLILFLALIVGIGTGIYPAKRATKISALDALRYE